MWPISTDFAAELAKTTYTSIVRADVLRSGAVQNVTLQVTGGAVSVDANASVRRRCSITVVDPTGALVPNDAADLLSPYGTELRLWRGVRYTNGTEEVVPLGTFRIASAKVEDDGAPVITIDGYDRARTVARARFETPYTVAAGVNYISAIQDLIASRLPGVAFSAITTASVTPLLVFDQAADPFKAAVSMAESIGAELFFDPLGVCVIRNEPNPATSPVVATFSATTGSTLLSISNNLNDEPGFNGFVVDGEPSAGAPVHFVVYDEDPTSPTYALGPYSKVPEFIKSQYITTLAQAEDAARAALRREKGGTEQVTITALPHPALEGGDLVAIKRDLIGVDGFFTAETFNVPLDPGGSMSLTTRKRRSA